MLRKKTIGFLLKIGIVVFAVFFLYEQFKDLSSEERFDLDVILIQIKEGYGLIIVVFIMMLVNWLLEALKWQFLISKIETITVKRSIRAVFSGITVSAFTPNRVGEYGGRVFCLQTADRGQGVLITIIGSMAQLLTTIFFGCIGLLFLPNYSPEFAKLIDSVEFGYPILVFLLLLLNVLMVVLFLNASMFSTMLSKINFLRKYEKYSEVFSYYISAELLKVLLYSVARYAVFTTQFFILLQLFDVDIVYGDAIVLNVIMLLIISVIPNYFPIFEVAQRGPVAISLFSLVAVGQTVEIFSATFVMWIINLLFPALIGTIFIFTLKFFRK